MKQRAVNSSAAGNVIVAVKAEKVISKTALAWTLSHVVHPGDCVMLLAVLPGHKTGRRRSLWSFPRLTGDCGTGDREKFRERVSHQISESCSQMVLQLHDQIEVRVRIKVVSDTPTGAVAAEAKSHAASWVILDKKLKEEQKHCLEEIHCNIVVMNGSHPKILRLNLGCSDHDELRTPFFSVPSSPVSEVGNLLGQRMKHSTPVGSPEENSLSSPDTVASLFLVYEQNPLFERPNKVNYSPSNKQIDFIDPITELDLDGERIVSLSPTPNSSITNNHKAVFWIPQNHSANENGQANRNLKKTHKTKQNQTHEIDSLSNSSIRKAVSLGRISSIPPPLCSLCQNKAPVFGKPPRRFNYRDLEEATDGFSDMNLVAEGGFGTVHRGVLRDGQVVAVKQLKCNGSKGDTDFCREVQVLSCAQHRNVVLLIGFCVERLSSRILVYEYICNGSLDFHLHGNKRTSLDWHSRQKIAIGAARGLRYLHEDCRVGCIVHRNLRPSNILLTHDYEPLVTDFGLARLHAEWGTCDEQVVGNSGYLAPEYLNGGKITEKADIYAFGLVLVELISGQRTRDLQSYEGDFCPLSALQFGHILAADKYQWQHTILGSNQSHNFPLEVHAMGRAAFLCLQPDPESRPPMSKVLRILEEGDGVIPLGLDLNSVGSRSVRIQDLSSNKQLESTRHSRRLSH